MVAPCQALSGRIASADNKIGANPVNVKHWKKRQCCVCNTITGIIAHQQREKWAGPHLFGDPPTNLLHWLRKSFTLSSIGFSCHADPAKHLHGTTRFFSGQGSEHRPATAPRATAVSDVCVYPLR
jgi:hypothetical protein